MPAKMYRRCPFCLANGITVEFQTGNKLRQHVKIRHPQSKDQKRDAQKKLKLWRRNQLVELGRRRA